MYMLKELLDISSNVSDIIVPSLDSVYNATISHTPYILQRYSSVIIKYFAAVCLKVYKIKYHWEGRYEKSGFN